MPTTPMTFIGKRGDQIEVALVDGVPTLASAAGAFILSSPFDPAEFREMGRHIVTTADRAEGRVLDQDAQTLLLALVDALEHTNWSSWQSTARFQKQWDEARAFIEQVPA